MKSGKLRVLFMDKYLDIINHFGEKPQCKKLMEEAFEFVETVYEYNANDINTREHLVEEMGDILLLLTEFIAKYEIGKPELDKVMDYKLERTLDRIKTGYYDK
jgi:NTP pyrophosphatase (non-canonical NTP hydrolase)